MSKRLEEIRRKNAEFEKESPYNYCNRWCERCVHEKQIRCIVYKDELECRMTCIAHGKNENDPEITKAVLEAQYKDADEKLSGHMDKFCIDLDNPTIDESKLSEENAIDFEDLPLNIQKHIEFVEKNPLDAAAKNYSDKAHAFLKRTFCSNIEYAPKLKHDFETISWYYILLPAKIHRALCGFHKPAAEGDISLYDTIAQFDICIKGIEESTEALKAVSAGLFPYKTQIMQLIALLHNLDSRIKIMIENI